jgi:hypothetical protein
MQILTIEQLEAAYVAAQIEKYKAIKMAYPKPLKVWRMKMIGRKVESEISPISGIPIDKVVSKGEKRPRFMTNEYTRLLQFYFEHYFGFSSKRISSEGKWRSDKAHPNGGRYIPSSNKGIEDIQVYLPNGVMIAVEVKGPRDRQRPEQVQRQSQLGRAYLIATADFEYFQKQFHETVRHFTR